MGVFDLKNGTGSGPVRAGSVCLDGGVDVGCVPHTSNVIGPGVLSVHRGMLPWNGGVLFFPQQGSCSPMLQFNDRAALEISIRR